MKNTAAAEDLIGSVKAVTTKTISVFENAGEIVERLESTSSCRFDESNNLIESRHTMPNGCEGKTVNRFDSQNRLIETVFYTNGVKQRREFSYDSENRLFETKYYDENNNLQNTHRHIYTKDNLRIEEIDYDTLFNGKRNPFDSVGFNIEPQLAVHFSGKDVSKSKTIHSADDKLLEVSFYNRQKKLKGKVRVAYDSDGVPLQVRKFGDHFYFFPYELKRWKIIFLDKIVWLHTALKTFYDLVIRGEFKKAGQCFIYGTPYEETNFHYDAHKRLVEIITFSTIHDGHRKTFKYDEKGNKSEETMYSGKDSISHSEKHEYEYDAQNNWIKRKTLYKVRINDGKYPEERTVLTYREIKY